MIGLQPLVTTQDLAAAVAAVYGDIVVDEAQRQRVQAALEAYGPRLIARLTAEDTIPAS